MSQLAASEPGAGTAKGETPPEASAPLGAPSCKESPAGAQRFGGRCWRLLGPAVLVVMLWRIGPEKCWWAIRSADAAWFLAACLVSIPALAIKSLRWQQLVRAVGFDLPFGASAGIYATGLLAGAVTPGKVGDLAKAPLLASRGVPWTAGLSAAVFDKLLDAGALIAVGLGGLLALPSLPGRGKVAVASAATIATALAVAMLFRRALKGGRLHGARWSVLAATTIAAVAAYFASVYGCAQALRLPLGPIDVVAGAAVAAALGSLPISVAGIGTRDAAFVVIFAQCGVDAEHALALSTLVLAWMAVNCLVYLLVSRLFLADVRPPHVCAE